MFSDKAFSQTNHLFYQQTEILRYLAEVIAERPEDPPEAIAGAVFNALTSFAGTKPLDDDTSLVIIKIL